MCAIVFSNSYSHSLLLGKREKTSLFVMICFLHNTNLEPFSQYLLRKSYLNPQIVSRLVVDLEKIIILTILVKITA